MWLLSEIEDLVVLVFAYWKMSPIPESVQCSDSRVRDFSETPYGSAGDLFFDSRARNVGETP